MDLVHYSTLLLLVTAVSAQSSDFRFSTIYGDHMVLQQAPYQASVWGYTSDCADNVTINFNQNNYPATLIKDTSGKCKWRVTLPATKASLQTTYTITATSQKYGSIKISDILFGDVWVCSGQSNMGFALKSVFNASVEIAKADDYQKIRLFMAALKTSPTPVDELLGITKPWSIADSDTVPPFSAVCWLYGRDLFNNLNYPIGLIATDWGGTAIELWSSPDSLAKCGVTNESGAVGIDHSVLWNAMIYPFLNMTIKGAIWYQGESNAGSNNYNCTFPAMIDDWREKWYTFTMQQTDPMFGFGFVQLAATGNSNKSNNGFPKIRWAQTANYGFVPNERLQNVFMAVAMDLGDPDSPLGSIHPRDKQDVGARLVLSARAVVYEDSTAYYQGPLANSATLISKGRNSIKVTVSYKLHTTDPVALELRYNYGFELGCGNGTTGASQWIEGTATGADKEGVHVEFTGCPLLLSPVSIRYCWRDDPCTFKMCPIYAGDLPSPPFMMDL